MIARGLSAESWLGTFLPARDQVRGRPELAELRRRQIEEPIARQDAAALSREPSTAVAGPSAPIPFGCCAVRGGSLERVYVLVEYPRGADTTATAVEEVCAARETSLASDARTGPAVKAAVVRQGRGGRALPRSSSSPAAEQAEPSLVAPTRRPGPRRAVCTAPRRRGLEGDLRWLAAFCLKWRDG